MSEGHERGARAVNDQRRAADRVPRPCPSCGALPSERLWRQDFAIIEGVSVLDGYDVVVCAACGMTFADGIPGQAAFDRYYRDASKYEFPHRGGAESAHDAARLSVTADAIASGVTDRSVRILDVGCATGRLLAELRTRGFTELRGIDPSPACVATARDRFALRADTATIAELGVADGPFDLIVLVGVLEHLVDLGAALAALRSRLSAHGALYVEVPDVTGFADWPNAPFQEFSVEHINYFSPRSLTGALRAHGLGAEWIERNTRDQSSGTTVANVAGLFRNGAIDHARPPADDESRTSVQHYVERCTDAEHTLRRRIDMIVGSQQPLFVWGTGTLALRLLATTALANANIVAFVDSNVRYQQHRLCGRTILAPSALASRDEAILIVSHGFEEEIRRQIKTVGRRDGRVFSLNSANK